MREIKFRAWNGGEMQYDFNPFPFTYSTFTNPIMQFTGLKDKNGSESKDVYGGDILYNSDRDEYQEVIYNEDEARWDVRYAHGEQRSLAAAIGNLNIVAGNIHQDSNLLES